MINIPAYVSDKGDIFDGPNVDDQIGATLDDRLRFVEQQESRALGCQGEPFRTYLARRFSDEEADGTLKSYVDRYLEAVLLPTQARWLGRIRRYFAVVYASAAQAIDYGILSWSKGRTLNDIAKCMADAMDQLAMDFRGSSQETLSLIDDSLVEEFRKKIKHAKFSRVNSCSRKQLKKSDGFIRSTRLGKIETFLYAKTLETWVPETTTRKRLTNVLRSRHLLKEGRRPDTSTRQVYVAQLGRKVSCYAIYRKRICS